MKHGVYTGRRGGAGGVVMVMLMMTKMRSCNDDRRDLVTQNRN